MATPHRRWGVRSCDSESCSPVLLAAGPKRSKATTCAAGTSCISWDCINTYICCMFISYIISYICMGVHGRMARALTVRGLIWRSTQLMTHVAADLRWQETCHSDGLPCCSKPVLMSAAVGGAPGCWYGHTCLAPPPAPGHLLV
jgi:hypothetical protein